MRSGLQPFTIADFINWRGQNRLNLSPDFQRGSVWTPSAKVYLIDTILNELPIPQVFFRTRINVEDQSIVREIVDGQQRLRAILEFASGKLRLSSKASTFNGKYYKDLDEEEQARFLAYEIDAVQLLNATDADVLEVFARLNSYSVRVSPAELRHARYTEPIKWAIYEAANQWMELWEACKVLQTREIVRLRHTSIMAEMFMIIDQGLDNGGEAVINSYYRSNVDKDEAYFERIRTTVDLALKEIRENTSEDLIDTIFYDPPNFLMLFASVAFLNGVTPNTRISGGIDTLFGRGADWDKAATRLSYLAQAFEAGDSESGSFSVFVSATKSSTHRFASRRVRLHTLVKALARDAVS